MILKLVRHTFTDKSTIGSLYINGDFECFTLEDVVRDFGPNGEGKVKGATAIPYGVFEITLEFMKHLRRICPKLNGIPFYSDVFLHWGNKADNTDGCPLVGQTWTTDWIGKSLLAFEALMPKIEAGLKTGQVYIQICKEDSTNGQGPVPTA